MKIIVDQAKFSAAVSLLHGIIEKRTTIPVLAEMLIEPVLGGLVLTGTELDRSLRVPCPATIEAAGPCTVNGHKLIEVVSQLPKGDVTLRTTTHQLIITGGETTARLGLHESSGFPAIPEFPTGDALTIPGKLLLRLLEATAFAVTLDESRYTLAAILFELEKGKLKCVATDGHRLSLASLPFEGEAKFLLHKRAVSELRRLVDAETTVDFIAGLDHLFFRFNSVVFVARRTAGNFPNYEMVRNLPEIKRSWTLSRTGFTEALKRVALLADERSLAVSLTFSEGKLKLHAGDADNDADETIPVQGETGGETFGANAKYLLEFLAAAKTEQVRIDFVDNETQVRMVPVDEKEIDFDHIIMPMRL